MSTLPYGEFVFPVMDRVIYGPGSVQKLADEVKRYGASKVIVICGNSIATKTPILKRVENILGEKHAGTYSEIKEHSPIDFIKKAVEFVISNKGDLLVSVGGGSPIDATKMISKWSSESGERTSDALTHIAIPTTLSGAEYTCGVGITDENKKKVTSIALENTVKTIILDGELTQFTPERLWLSSGIRAMDHAVETFYALRNGANVVHENLALEAMKKLFCYLPKCKTDPSDVNARQELQLASFLSIYPSPAFVSLGLSHMLGHMIGASYDVPHGITSCLTLPAVMKYQSKINPEKMSKILRGLKPELASDNHQKNGEIAAHLVQELIDELGLTSKLSDYKLTDDDIQEIAKSTAEHAKEIAETLAEHIANVIPVKDIVTILKQIQ